MRAQSAFLWRGDMKDCGGDCLPALCGRGLFLAARSFFVSKLYLWRIFCIIQYLFSIYLFIECLEWRLYKVRSSCMLFVDFRTIRALHYFQWVWGQARTPRDQMQEEYSFNLIKTARKSGIIRYSCRTWTLIARVVGAPRSRAAACESKQCHELALIVASAPRFDDAICHCRPWRNVSCTTQQNT